MSGRDGAVDRIEDVLEASQLGLDLLQLLENLTEIDRGTRDGFGSDDGSGGGLMDRLRGRSRMDRRLRSHGRHHRNDASHHRWGSAGTLSSLSRVVDG